MEEHVLGSTKATEMATVGATRVVEKVAVEKVAVEEVVTEAQHEGVGATSGDRGQGLGSNGDQSEGASNKKENRVGRRMGTRKGKKGGSGGGKRKPFPPTPTQSKWAEMPQRKSKRLALFLPSAPAASPAALHQADKGVGEVVDEPGVGPPDESTEKPSVKTGTTTKKIQLQAGALYTLKNCGLKWTGIRVLLVDRRVVRGAEGYDCLALRGNQTVALWLHERYLS